MIYKYTTCESVIAKIMADLDSTEVRLRTTDIKEWIFEAVDKIGAPMLYIEKEVEMPLIDKQAPIPADLLILDGVAYKHNKDCKWSPMVKTTAVFKQPKKKHGPHFVVETERPDLPEIVYNKYSKLVHAGRVNYELNDDPEYFIKPGWIVITNRDCGFVKLAYKAILSDDKGYPLIPDSTSYQEAIYWYVVMKLNFPKMVNKMGSNISGKAMQATSNIYFYTLQQWNFYRNQAYAEAMMPTADDMRNIKNQWNKLVPDWDSDDTFFRHMNDRESIYNDYYYGY